MVRQVEQELAWGDIQCIETEAGRRGMRWFDDTLLVGSREGRSADTQNEVDDSYGGGQGCTLGNLWGSGGKGELPLLNRTRHELSPVQITNNPEVDEVDARAKHKGS